MTAALWLSRLLTGMLYDVTPTDPVTYANIALLMLAVAADRELPRLDEKLFLDVFAQAPRPKATAGKKR